MILRTIVYCAPRRHFEPEMGGGGVNLLKNCTTL